MLFATYPSLVVHQLQHVASPHVFLRWCTDVDHAIEVYEEYNRAHLDAAFVMEGVLCMMTNIPHPYHQGLYQVRDRGACLEPPQD
jgi:hypothetical protein